MDYGLLGIHDNHFLHNESAYHMKWQVLEIGGDFQV